MRLVASHGTDLAVRQALFELDAEVLHPLAGRIDVGNRDGEVTKPYQCARLVVPVSCSRRRSPQDSLALTRSKKTYRGRGQSCPRRNRQSLGHSRCRGCASASSQYEGASVSLYRTRVQARSDTHKLNDALAAEALLAHRLKRLALFGVGEKVEGEVGLLRGRDERHAEDPLVEIERAMRVGRMVPRRGEAEAIGQP